MGNYLTTLANAIGGLLGGGQTVQPNAPLSASGGPVQATAPAQPPPAGASSSPAGGPPSAPSGGFMQGAENFLGSPLTQGALASYFSAIGSPRKAGLGGMLSRGGLSGLSAYDTAEEAQQKAALQAAQLPQMQAQTAATQAQTQLTQAQALQLAGIKQQNQQTAAALNAASASMPPAQKQAAVTIANMIANSTNKAYDPTELLAAIYTDPAKAQEAVANTALANARTSAIPSEIAKNQATASEAAANTAAIPTKTAIEQEKADAAKAKAATAPAVKTNSLTNLKTLQSLYTAQYGGISGVLESGAAKTIGRPGRPSFGQFAVTSGYDPTSGQALGLAPSGMTWRFDPVQNRAETIDATGKVTGYFVPS
jgi:hypothetical protein